MINSICKAILGKEIIIFQPHRNSNPVVNETTKKQYVFLNPRNIWKAAAIFGKDSKLRYRAVGSILSMIDPVAIIDINWTYKTHSLYFAWCRRHGKKFIVIQHGIYIAGVVQDIREKYVKCTTHLVWGKHFKQMREQNNRGKNCDFIIYGNPVYNQFNRSRFTYKEVAETDILVAVSVIEGKRLEILHSFLNKLKSAGFNVSVKEHNLQHKKSTPIQWEKKSDKNLYTLLKMQRYDYVVTDISSAMTDIIFFKNRAIYFSPEGEDDHNTNNVYERFLVNIATREGFFSDKEDLLSQVSIEAQENMLKYLIQIDGTSNTLKHIIDH